MKRIATIIVGLVTSAAWLTAAPIHSDAASGTGCTVWTVPANDAEQFPAPLMGPQNDLVRATLSTKGDILVVRVYVQDMTLQLPLGATSMGWELFTTGFIEADVDLAGNVSYWDGQDGGTAGHPTLYDTGTIVQGPGGYVEIDVPFSHFGLRNGAVIPYTGGAALINGGQVDNVFNGNPFRIGGC